MPPMTRDVVLLVVGALFTLIALVGNIKIREIAVQLAKTQRCILGAIGGILLVLGVFGDQLFPSETTEKAPAAAPSATASPSARQKPQVDLLPANGEGIVINQPADGDMVGGETEVSGSYDPATTDDIWVIVWPEKAPGRGWPQTDDGRQGLPCAKRDGKWAVHCYFGGPAQTYKVVVYTATSSASQVISSSLRSWYKKDDYAGISRANLPQGLKEQGEIKVRKGASI